MAVLTTEIIAVRRVILPSIVPIVLNRARMTITPDNDPSKVISIPFAPIEVDHQEHGMAFSEIERPKLPPMLRPTGRRLPEMSFDLIVMDKPPYARAIMRDTTVTTAESVLAQLDTLASLGQRVKVSYGGRFEAGVWYITGFNFNALKRNQYDQITQARVSLAFKRADDNTDSTGPITGGYKPPSPTPPPPAPPQQTGAREYIVKSGDTLWAISVKFYGTGSRWQKIADANGIKDPKKLRIGTKLRIPS